MSHQPFENWLLSEDELSPEQTRQLQEHLRACETCRKTETAWFGVKRLIRATPDVTPAPGFSARWQARLAEQQRQRFNRQALLIFGFNVGATAVLVLALLAEVVQLLRAPQHMVLFGVYRLASFYIYADAVHRFLLSTWRTVLLTVPPLMWIFVPGILSLVMVLWIVIYKQLTMNRRINA